MKKLTVKQNVLGLLCFLSITVVVMAGEAKLQETCPIMGGKINKDLYVDALGQRIYVCCAGCVATIKNDPEAALKKLGDKGEFAESLQETCPVMGGKVNKDLYVEHEGRRIYVCCAGCIDTIKKDPAKYAAKISEKFENKKENAYQGHNH